MRNLTAGLDILRGLFQSKCFMNLCLSLTPGFPNLQVLDFKTQQPFATGWVCSYTLLL